MESRGIGRPCRLAIGTAALSLWCWVGAALAQGEIYVNKPSPASKAAQRVSKSNPNAAPVDASNSNEQNAAVQAAQAAAEAAKADAVKLRAENRELTKRNADLVARLAALSGNSKGQGTALENEKAARQKAEQDANEQRAANRRLESEVDKLSKDNTNLRQKLDGDASSLDKATEALGKSGREVKDAQHKLADANRRTADRDRTILDMNKNLDFTTARLRQFENRARELGAELATLRRDRWLWVAGLALLGAALAGVGIRLWWPKTLHVVKPLSLSVGLGAWSISAPSPVSAPHAPFRVRTQWLPGESQVRASGALDRRPEVAAVHGEIA